MLIDRDWLAGPFFVLSDFGEVQVTDRIASHQTGLQRRPRPHAFFPRFPVAACGARPRGRPLNEWRDSRRVCLRAPWTRA